MVFFYELNASTGSNFAALNAGFNPKNIPTKTEKTKEIIQASKLITKAIFLKPSTARLVKIPITIPHKPPTIVILADSIKNC